MPEFALLSRERIIFRTRPHILVLLYEVFLIAAVMLVSGLFLSNLEIFGISTNAILLYVFSITGTVVMLDWWTTRFYLTNIRVIKSRGIIGKNSISIPLEKIQDISYSFGILGRIFGFGNLVIESAGGQGRIEFKQIPAPWKVRARIQDSIQRQKNFHSSWQEE